MAFQALVVTDLVKHVVEQRHVAEDAQDESLHERGIPVIQAPGFREAVDDVEGEELSVLPLYEGFEGELAGIGGHQ